MKLPPSCLSLSSAGAFPHRVLCDEHTLLSTPNPPLTPFLPLWVAIVHSRSFIHPFRFSSKVSFVGV